MILELPMKQDNTYEYLWRATVHHRPLVNGVSSYIPPAYARLKELYDADPIPLHLYDELERIGCSIVVVHEATLRERAPAVRAWLRDGIAAHRVAFVQRFESGRHGDFVFALGHHAQPLAAEAETFLSGGINRFDNTCGKVDIGPEPVERGDLNIVGWATSAAGIDHVNLRFANGRFLVRAEPDIRDDVRSILPWHPDVFGFHKSVTPLVDGDTDMQVEIVDKNGAHVRVSPFWFNWHRHPIPGLTWRDDRLDALLQRLGQNAARIRPRIVSGRAAIFDYTPGLLTDPLYETDIAFCDRLVRTLLGREPDSRMVSPYLRMLTNGVARERVIEAVVMSNEFAATYLVSGSLRNPRE